MAKDKEKKEEEVEPVQAHFGEGEEDFKERIQKFSDELRPLLGKYELGLAAIPEITPQGLTVARPIFASTRKPSEAPKAEGEAEKPAPVDDDKGGLSE